MILNVNNLKMACGVTIKSKKKKKKCTHALKQSFSSKNIFKYVKMFI